MTCDAPFYLIYEKRKNTEKKVALFAYELLNNKKNI